MGSGTGLTVTVTELKQPVGKVYVITALPGEMPLTVPVALTDATPKMALVHTPPPLIFANVVVAPTQITAPPVIGANGFTVISFVAAQLPNVYVKSTFPGASAVTVPATIVAIDALLLLQSPPGTVSVSVVELPRHNVGTPEIGAGV
jgi:hypothetical protein